MTNAEYRALMSEARKMFPKLTMKAMRDLKKVYSMAADEVALKVIAAQKKGLSELTSQSLRSIEIQLQESGERIAAALRGQVEYSVLQGSKRLTQIHKDYLYDLTKYSAGKITKAGIRNMYLGVDRRVMESLVSRIYQNGYTFSETIWRAGQAYGPKIKNVISSGLSQGRDVLQIAKDIQVYVKKGKKALANRYGDLARGTKDFMKRIGNRVDYNALRLVRSELYSSMQTAARIAGQVNPASTGWYNWIRASSTDWGCDCPENAKGSPYQLSDLPDYPHPNCLCRIEPILMSHKKFKADLTRWSAGENVPYMDDWYNNYYL